MAKRKYQVGILSDDVYIVEAESAEEARYVAPVRGEWRRGNTEIDVKVENEAGEWVEADGEEAD